MKKLLIILLLLLPGYGRTQELRDTFFYTSNLYILNDAAIEEQHSLNGIMYSSLTQMNTQGIPAYQLGSAVRRNWENMGVGVRVNYRRQGLISTTKLNLSYAYEFAFNEETYCAFGLSVGMVDHNWQLNPEDLGEATDLQDPLLYANTGKERFLFTNSLSMSMIWRGLMLGGSFPDLYALATEDLSGQNYYTVANAYATYLLPIAREFTLQPILAAEWHKLAAPTYDISLKGMYSKVFWLSTGWRWDNNWMVSSGIALGDFEVGYAFLKSVGDFGSFDQQQHELSIVFRMDRSFRSADKLMNRPGFKSRAAKQKWRTKQLEKVNLIK
ncbi:PorP/SprF family type IX secretion system membrane protein [Algivirga pacifica]|uniref:Type IX secretion system membrane protein, PorP/SprF family n=1 Tax=Algivirga pacifica TaxID=1162670 RepID=A0ABP9DF34_9BACT